MSTTSDIALAGGAFTRPGLRQAARRIGGLLFFAGVPAVLLVVIVAGSLGDHFAFDFHQFWQGGRDVLDGRSPYPPAASLPSGGDPALGPVAIQHVFRFPYPAPAALVLVPFALLPFTLAASLFVLLSTAAVFLALRLLEMRDWRCYGIVFASIVTLGALRLGTFTPFLLLGLAAAWRFRDRRVLVACVVAALIVAKLFLWPLLVWLVLSRRLASAALAVALAATVTVASWAVLGFAGFGDYPKLLSSLAASVQGKGWSLVALGLSAGLSSAAAKALSLAIGVVVIAAAVAMPRQRRDFSSFTLTIVAAIVLSPIVWLHYFLLLVAPLAIAYPTLAPGWLIPLAFWVWPFQETGGDTWKIAFGLAALASVSATTLVWRTSSQAA